MTSSPYHVLSPKWLSSSPSCTKDCVVWPCCATHTFTSPSSDSFSELDWTTRRVCQAVSDLDWIRRFASISDRSCSARASLPSWHAALAALSRFGRRVRGTAAELGRPRPRSISALAFGLKGRCSSSDPKPCVGWPRPRDCDPRVRNWPSLRGRDEVGPVLVPYAELKDIAPASARSSPRRNELSFCASPRDARQASSNLRFSWSRT